MRNKIQYLIPILATLTIINCNENKQVIVKSTPQVVNRISIQNQLKKGFRVIDEIDADLDGDSDLDKIYIASSQDEIIDHLK